MTLHENNIETYRGYHISFFSIILLYHFFLYFFLPTTFTHTHAHTHDPRLLAKLKAKLSVVLATSNKFCISEFRLERSSVETNDRAPRTLKKKPRDFWEKKRKKKNERPLALTESYYFLHCHWKSEKEQFYTRSPRGGPRWIYHIPHRSK